MACVTEALWCSPGLGDHLVPVVSMQMLGCDIDAFQKDVNQECLEQLKNEEEAVRAAFLAAQASD